MTDPDSRSNLRVDWLELFFDLVFVVIIKQLTDLLHGEPGLNEFGEVVGLFAVVWIAWLNVTTLMNLSGERSMDRRLPVLVSMAGVALIAVSIPNATGNTAVLFVIGLAVARIAVWPVWIRLSRDIRGGWIRITLYGPGIAALWLATISIPEGVRVWAWAALVIAELVYTSVSFSGSRFAVSHLLERVGLFVMIVLGESVVELIMAVKPQQSPVAWAVSAGSFLLICVIWWHHYQQSAPLAERLVGTGSDTVLRDVVVVARFFIVLGLIGLAAGLGSAIEDADEPHLPYGSVVALAGGIACYHLASVIMAWRLGVPLLQNALIAMPGIVLVAVFVAIGVRFPAWVLILGLLAYMGANRLIGPWTVRRLPVASANFH